MAAAEVALTATAAIVTGPARTPRGGAARPRTRRCGAATRARAAARARTTTEHRSVSPPLIPDTSHRISILYRGRPTCLLLAMQT